jgi:hypothetical protein
MLSDFSRHKRRIGVFAAVAALLGASDSHAAEIAAAASPQVHLGWDGLRVGDWLIRALPAFSTDDHLDTERGRELARRSEYDRRVSEPSPRSLFGSSHLGGLQVSAGGGRYPPWLLLPVSLRDPITGAAVGPVRVSPSERGSSPNATWGTFTARGRL